MINSYLANVYRNKDIVLDHLERYEETINCYDNVISMRPHIFMLIIVKERILKRSEDILMLINALNTLRSRE